MQAVLESMQSNSYYGAVPNPYTPLSSTWQQILDHPLFPYSPTTSSSSLASPVSTSSELSTIPPPPPPIFRSRANARPRTFLDLASSLGKKAPTTIELIRAALLEFPDRKATSAEICEEIARHDPRYQSDKRFGDLSGNVRQRLSATEWFQLAERPTGHRGKARYWKYVETLDQTIRRRSRSSCGSGNSCCDHKPISEGPSSIDVADRPIAFPLTNTNLTPIASSPTLDTADASNPSNTSSASSFTVKNHPISSSSSSSSSSSFPAAPIQTSVTSHADLDGLGGHPMESNLIYDFLASLPPIPPSVDSLTMAGLEATTVATAAPSQTTAAPSALGVYEDTDVLQQYVHADFL
ncbi:hypothetical protein FRB96_006744 [Tulasnella sp. 330]|nr:hypothetical protein FRB96_006744 [Tulasnella sp. 330]